jgi:WD40 repeat protein
MSDGGKRYRAFISYSQKDKAVAKRLHQALQTWRAPKGVPAEGLAPGRKLGAFFRDEEEMGSADSLGAALEGAIDDSEHLIVVASPASAQSKWVGAEIRRFKRRPGAKVFAVIARGNPGSGDLKTECFHDALKEKIGPDGRPAGEPDEPLAPNLKREGRSKIVARLAAGFLGLRFETLWGFEKRRRAARAWRAAGAMAVVLLAVGLGGGYVYGLQAVAAAEQRAARFAEAAHQLTDEGDHARAMLMALHGDPAARRGLLEPVLARNGYASATASLERAYTGNRLMATMHVGGPIRAVSFAQAGMQVLSGTTDGVAQLWMFGQDEPSQSFVGCGGLVTSAAFASGGTRVLAGCDDGTARLWSVERAELVGAFDHGSPITSVALAPNGGRVVMGSADGTANVWSIGKDEPDETLSRDQFGVRAVAFSPDGAHVLTGSARTATLWTIGEAEPAATFARHARAISDLAFAPDGAHVFSASVDGTVKAWQATGGESATIDTAIASFAVSGSDARSVAIHPDGQHVLTGSANGTAELWLLDRDGPIGTFAAGDTAILSVAFAPDGSSAITGSYDGIARSWRIDDPPLQTFQGRGEEGRSVAFRSDGTHVLIGSADNSLALWRLGDGEPLLTLASPGGSILAGDANGERLLSGSEDGTTFLWLVGQDAPTQRFANDDGAVRAAVFHPDGEHIVTGSREGQLRLWRIGEDHPIQTFAHHAAGIGALHFSPLGDRLVTIAPDGESATLWEIGRSEPVQDFADREGRVTSIAFHPDGDNILIGFNDGSAKLWQVGELQSLQTFTASSGEILPLHAALDEARVLTGSRLGTQLWRIGDDHPIQTFPNHGASISAVMFRPGGVEVLTGYWDGGADVWAIDPFLFLSPDEQFATACATLAEIGAPLAFTAEDRQRFPILQGEPESPCAPRGGVWDEFVSVMRGG